MERKNTSSEMQFEQLYDRIINMAKEKNGEDREKFIYSIESILTGTPKMDYETPVEVLDSVEPQMKK